MRTVLRRPDFRLLFAGLVASMVAESILLLALAVWVKDLTGSDGSAGATIFAIIAPMTLAPLVGWFVDRYPRRLREPGVAPGPGIRRRTGHRAGNRRARLGERGPPDR